MTYIKFQCCECSRKCKLESVFGMPTYCMFDGSKCEWEVATKENVAKSPKSSDIHDNWTDKEDVEILEQVKEIVKATAPKENATGGKPDG